MLICLRLQAWPKSDAFIQFIEYEKEISQYFKVIDRGELEQPRLAAAAASSTHQMSEAESRSYLLLYSICGRQTFIQYPCLMRVRQRDHITFPLSTPTKRARISSANLYFISYAYDIGDLLRIGTANPFISLTLTSCLCGKVIFL